MFINNINPVLLSLGPLQIRYYGLVYALGFLAAYYLIYKFSKEGKIKNMTSERSDILTLYMIIGGIAGGRLFHFIFYNLASLIQNPLELFYIWHGGMSFHGGLLGMAFAIWLFCRRYHVSFYKVADLIAIPSAFFLFLGRVANFINSELVGIVTNSEKTPWCVVFEKVDDACRHPSQLYEAGKNLLIFGTLMMMRLKGKLKDGIAFWTFILMYGTLRFITNIWRDDPRLYGISTGQFLSLLMIPVAIYFLWKINRKKPLH
ncbi:prolipoprotein diacylglyceryl transferase [Candidatus Woesearchaeota archaeon]|nr:prolipoprotein diacylglyceryl transferase [Candidatus Woesearchaeota archaeon]